MKCRLGRFATAKNTEDEWQRTRMERVLDLATQGLRDLDVAEAEGDEAAADASDGRDVYLRRVEHAQAELEQLLDAAQVMPELREVLGPSHRDAWWLQQIHDELERAEPARMLRMQLCEHDDGDGYTAVAATASGLTRQITFGDTIMAGFAALRDADGEVRVWPRIYRVVCRNGQLQLQNNAGDLVEAGATPAEAVRASLTGQTVDSACARYRAAARQRVDDPLAVLLAAPAHVLPELRDSLPGVLDEFRRAQDRTLFGLINAITATARGAADARRRLRMEQAAGSLARLLVPQRRRVGRVTLDPRSRAPVDAGLRAFAAKS